MTKKDKVNKKLEEDENELDAESFEAAQGMELCWNCANLEVEHQSITCAVSNSFFLPNEVAFGECLQYIKVRNLSCPAISLLRILIAIDGRIAIHSLPERYIGSMGLLLRNNLAKISYASVMTRDPNSTTHGTKKEKFVELIPCQR